MATNNGLEVTPQGEDRLTSLPDDIIVNILSRLTLKFAASTARLSRRWRYLWTKIDAVTICIDDFNNMDEVIYILNHVFTQLTLPTIRKFHLTPWNHISATKLEISEPRRWFRGRCARNLEEAKLLTWGCNGLIPQLPTYFWTSNSLVSLELSDGRFIGDDDINLPRMKKLSVAITCFTGWDLSKKLINACPLLEDLSLDLFFSDYTRSRSEPNPLPWHRVYSISGKNLRRLYVGFYFSGKVVIDAPNLENFSLVTTYRSSYSVEINAIALLKAFITDRSSGYRKPLLSELFVGFSSVRSLTITSSSLEVRIMFPYLTELTLDQELSSYRNFNANEFFEFLCRCPILKVLVLHLRLFYNPSHPLLTYATRGKFSVPDCLVTHLKRVEIRSWTINSATLNLVQRLLRNAQALELLVFKRCDEADTDYHYHSSEEITFCKALYKCQRSSSRCQIEFSGHSLKVSKGIIVRNKENDVTIQRLPTIVDNCTQTLKNRKLQNW